MGRNGGEGGCGRNDKKREEMEGRKEGWGDRGGCQLFDNKMYTLLTGVPITFNF